VKGIRPNVYPRKGVIHAFQTLSIVQEHHEKKSREQIIDGGPWKILKFKIYEKA